MSFKVFLKKTCLAGPRSANSVQSLKTTPKGGGLNFGTIRYTVYGMTKIGNQNYV
jgi:hypothetical protein